MTQAPFHSKLYALPTTQLILGTHIGDKPNFMALAWATRVNFEPPLIGIAVNKNNASHAAIVDHGQFSLCMPTTTMVQKTDYVGLVSAHRTDKSELFELFYGKLDKAPLISECPLNLELSLFETVSLPTNTLFIGEVVGKWCKEECLSDGIPDIEKIAPFILTMPDNRFWSFGKQAGKAWQDGKQYKKSLSNS